MVDITTKAWRSFLFGTCCGFLGIYIKRALIQLQMIKGDLLSYCMILFLTIWLIFSFARIYRLNKRYPEYKNEFQKDKYCVIGYILVFILVIGLKILPE